MKENEFTLKKVSRRYPAETIMEADYIALLVNTPTQVECLLHSPELVALASMWMQIKCRTCFNLEGDISTLNVGSLKLVDKFMDFGCSTPSTESNTNMCLSKGWTINKLSIIWKSDLSDEIKCNFFQAVVVSIPPYGCTTWTLTKCIEKKLNGTAQECYKLYWTNPRSITPQNSNRKATYLLSLKPSSCFFLSSSKLKIT